MARVHGRLAWEWAMAAVSGVSVMLLVAVRQRGIGPLGLWGVLLLDGVLVAVSIGDWLAGLARAADRRRYVLATAAELPGLVPLAVSFAGPLRFLRLLRIARIRRAVGSTHSHMADKEVPQWVLHVHGLGWAAVGVVLAGALLLLLVERPDNPDLATYGDALWWALVTVTTVGYGDIVPVTRTGRAVAAVLMVAGIALFALLVSVLARAMGRRGEAGPGDGGQGGVEHRLERLARLHRQGDLSDQEYRAAKRRVLER